MGIGFVPNAKSLISRNEETVFRVDFQEIQTPPPLRIVVVNNNIVKVIGIVQNANNIISLFVLPVFSVMNLKVPKVKKINYDSFRRIDLKFWTK